MTEILSPRIARQGAVCLISTRGQARKARIEKFELDEGFQPYHHHFQTFELTFKGNKGGPKGGGLNIGQREGLNM